MTSPPRQIDLRRGRVSIPNHVYHVTTTTLARVSVFADFRAARLLMQTLMANDAIGSTHTIACVVMPDHLHWLFSLGESQTLSKVVQAVKSISARKIGGAIWQGGFHDHALRTEDSLENTARYIIANPVRAGIAIKVGDYSHWHAIYL